MFVVNSGPSASITKLVLQTTVPVGWPLGPVFTSSQMICGMSRMGFITMLVTHTLVMPGLRGGSITTSRQLTFVTGRGGSVPICTVSQTMLVANRFDRPMTTGSHTTLVTKMPRSVFVPITTGWHTMLVSTVASFVPMRTGLQTTLVTGKRLVRATSWLTGEAGRAPERFAAASLRWVSCVGLPVPSKGVGRIGTGLPWSKASRSNSAGGFTASMLRPLK